MRLPALFVLVYFLAVLLAPAFVVADFWLQRDRVMQELCVQRMVPGAQRTCHGDCYLMRQLHKTEQREKGMPTELRALRLDDMTAERTVLAVPHATDADAIHWPAFAEALHTGHPSLSDPVPWG